MTSPSRPKRGRLALLGAAIALAGLLVGPPAHAADGSLAVDSPSIAIDETVTFTFDAGTAVHDRNWIGIYRDGVVPGGPASLDWRYVPTAAGEVTWNPSTREGWTRNSSTMGAGEYDVYLLEDDGYNVLAGPIDLTVTDDTTMSSAAPLTQRELVTVVGNLVDNAIDAAAGSPGGDDNPWVEVTLTADDAALDVRVADSGPGMSADEFAAASRRGYSTKSDHHGLGLALVAQVVSRHGGRIESENTYGAVVSVHVPKEGTT